MNQSRKTQTHEFLIADVLTMILEGATYFGAFSLPLLFLFHFRDTHPLFLLLLFLPAWVMAAFAFVLILVLIKRLAIGPIPPGRFFVTGKKAYKWIVADRLVKILQRSPFRTLVNDNGFLRYFYLRGMGARIHPTLLLGQRVVIPEPWALKVGKNVIIGDEAIVSGHKVERNVVTLDDVEIGDDALIGARSLLLPGVRIGAGAVIGAGTIFTRGTIVGPGETWSGNPARKMDLFNPGGAVSGNRQDVAERRP